MSSDRESSYCLRPITESDTGALLAMYRETRWEELQQVAWSDEQRRTFLAHQFEAQHQHYQQYFPRASFQVIEVEGATVGRLYLDRRSDEIRIVDIIVIAAHRNAGLGGRILDDVLAEAAGAALPVRIHVEKSNPALRLYQRKGFTRKGDAGVYWLMECAPASSAARLNRDS